jgi:hypothetical protein
MVGASLYSFFFTAGFVFSNPSAVASQSKLRHKQKKDQQIKM